MTKNATYRSLLGGCLLSLSSLLAPQNAGAQANDWLFQPNVKFDATTGTATTFTSGAAITTCTPGPSPIQRVGVVSDASAGTYYAFNYCGIYNSSGAQVKSGGVENMFWAPESCNTYYSILWENVPGSSNYNKLVLRQIDASNPAALTDAGATDLINNHQRHYGANLAIAPLSTVDYSRKIYVTDGYSLKLYTMDKTGSMSTASTIYTLPELMEARTRMELSPDGTKLFMVSETDKIYMYNVTSNTLTTVADYSTAPGTVYIVGFEFVPAAVASSTDDRLYISYNSGSGAGGIFYYTLGATISGPTNPISTYPTPKEFGFTEIELAKNGLLYFASNPDYLTAPYEISHPGVLYSLNPASGSLATVSLGASVATVANWESNWGYLIQSQIDGENYELSNFARPTVVGTNSINNIYYTGSSTSVYVCNNHLDYHIVLGGGYQSYYMIGVSGSSNSSSFTVYSQTKSPTIDLVSFAPWLASYTGSVMVDVTVMGCGGQASTETWYIAGNNATIASFSGIKSSTGYNIPKPLPDAASLPIVSPMPGGSTFNDFKTNIDASNEWVGANSSMGVMDITTNGSYVLKVYQADPNTGARYVDPLTNTPAPDITTKSSSGPVTSTSVIFNNSTTMFDSSNPPFYESGSANSFFNYFKDYYMWAYNNSADLTEYSARVYCVEFEVTLPTGCVGNNKRYFRIASNPGLGAAFGANAKLASGGNVADQQVSIYPNPTNSSFKVRIPTNFTDAAITVENNLGQVILSYQLTSYQESINIENLSSGIYYYHVTVDGEKYDGKLIKQ